MKLSVLLLLNLNRTLTWMVDCLVQPMDQSDSGCQCCPFFNYFLFSFWCRYIYLMLFSSYLRIALKFMGIIWDGYKRNIPLIMPGHGFTHKTKCSYDMTWIYCLFLVWISQPGTCLITIVLYFFSFYGKSLIQGWVRWNQFSLDIQTLVHIVCMCLPTYYTYWLIFSPRVKLRQLTTQSKLSFLVWFG